MNRKETIPEPISQLHRQLEEYRRTRPRRAKLPDSLWDAAVELARQHGVYAVAQPLRLDYMGLKKRLDAVTSRRPDSRRPPASFRFSRLSALHFLRKRPFYGPFRTLTPKTN